MSLRHDFGVGDSFSRSFDVPSALCRDDDGLRQVVAVLPEMDNRRADRVSQAKIIAVITHAAAAHWDELLRLATSIRTGTVTASAMLRELSAYPRQNSLALALRDVGRSNARSSCSTGYKISICAGGPRRGSKTGEARNALARALFFNQLGQLRDRRFENQSYRASPSHLSTQGLQQTRGVQFSTASMETHAGPATALSQGTGGGAPDVAPISHCLLLSTCYSNAAE